MRTLADRILILEAQARAFECRLQALEGRTEIIAPRYHEPPRIGAETYHPEFWDRMDAMG